MLAHGLKIRQVNPAHDVVTRIPGLGIKHIEGVELVLHTEVHQTGVVFPEYALVKIQRPQPIIRLKPQPIRQERKMMQVSRAHDDGIDLLAGAVFKVTGVLVHTG